MGGGCVRSGTSRSAWPAITTVGSTGGRSLNPPPSGLCLAFFTPPLSPDHPQKSISNIYKKRARPEKIVTPAGFGHAPAMPAILLPLRASGLALSLLLLCSCATPKSGHPALPAAVPMNPAAGRGGDLLVTLHLATGEELPMILDTGTGGTLLDKSWGPKLGQVLGTADEQGWGVHSKDDIYAMPKLYLGNTPLQTGGYVVTHDFQGMTDGAGHPAAGILGLDTLQNYCLQFDFTTRQIRFLDPAQADKQKWGRAFPLVPLNSKDSRPAIAWNLLGVSGPHSLIDSGCDFDGWLMPVYFRQWTNQSLLLPDGEAHAYRGAAPNSLDLEGGLFSTILGHCTHLHEMNLNLNQCLTLKVLYAV